MSSPSHVEHEHHSSTGLDNRKLAVWAFLGSETMFFGCFILVMLINKHNTLGGQGQEILDLALTCLLYTSPSPRDATLSRMPSSA